MAPPRHVPYAACGGGGTTAAPSPTLAAAGPRNEAPGAHLHAGPRVPERVAVGARQPLRALAEPAPRLGNQAHVGRKRAEREVQVRVAALAQRAHTLRRPTPGGLGARHKRARPGRT